MNFNKVILAGNITRDPQLSYTPNQTAVVDFGMAINRNWKGKDGEKREETCYVDCRAFSKGAENINKYVKKGDPLMVEGRLTYDSWEGKDGVKRNKLRVTVENFQFMGQPKSEPRPEPKSEPAPEKGFGDEDTPF